MNKKLLAAIIISVMALTSGCGGSGITKEEYDAVVSERDKAAAERDTYKQLYDDLLKEKSSETAEVPAADVTPSSQETEEAADNTSPSSEDPAEAEEPEAKEADADQSVEAVSTDESEPAEAAGETESTGYAIKSGKYWYYCILTKNDTNETVDISANLIIKDKDGNMTGAKTLSQDTVRAGDEALLTTIMSDAGDDPIFEYTLSSTPSRNTSAMDDISVEITMTDSKVIITAVNNGSEAAKFPHADALFMNGEDAVWTDGIYLDNNGTELAPGETVVKEIKCRHPFTDTKVCYTSRR